MVDKVMIISSSKPLEFRNTQVKQRLQMEESDQLLSEEMLAQKKWEAMHDDYDD